MKQRLTGRQTFYDSTKDKEPPVGFWGEVAKSVGVPEFSKSLWTPSAGSSSERIARRPAAPARARSPCRCRPSRWRLVTPGQFPKTLKSSWKGALKKIQTRQQFKLDDVKNGIATISIDIAILTPVRDPAIEAQLIQRASSGQVKFDIDAGRIVSHQTDLDKQVFGFSGETSTMHYRTRFVETLLPRAKTAAKPKVAGPELPVRK